MASEEIVEIAFSKDWFEDYVILEYYYKKCIAIYKDYVSDPVGPPDITVREQSR